MKKACIFIVAAVVFAGLLTAQTSRIEVFDGKYKNSEIRELLESNSQELTCKRRSDYGYSSVPSMEQISQLQTIQNYVGKGSRGSTAYAYVGYPGLWYISLDVDDFMGYSTISTSLPALYGGGLYEGILYAYDEDGSFYKINAETGEIISVFDLHLHMIVSAVCYDYSTEQMYALCDGAIYTVNLNTGLLNFVAPINSNEYLAMLAIDAEGTFYSISFGDASLYTLDKNNGNVTFIGSTGRTDINYAQSMGFDLNTGKLYWNESIGASPTFQFWEVNTQTGEVTLVAGNTGVEVTNFNVVGIPYPLDSPAAVTNFTVTPGANGALNAVLNWTNPTTTVSGDPLTDLTAINIYQDNELIHSIANPTVGGNGTYSVTVPVSNMYNYAIIPENSAGEGAPTKINIYLGIDVPGAPTNVVLTSQDNNGIITWTAPTTGLHGGWFEVSSLTYTVTRLPENIVIATGLTATTFTDNTVETINYYIYKITSVNSAGTGGETLSNPLVFGETINAPYRMGFEDNESWQIWSGLDGSDTVQPGEWNNFIQYPHSGVRSATYIYDFIGYSAADAWLFSPPLNFESSKTYKIRFWTSAYHKSYPEKMEVFIATGITPESVIGDAIWVDDNITNEEYIEYEIMLSGYDAGDYYIGFHCFSDPMMFLLFVDDFYFAEHSDIDAAAEMLYGNLTPMVGKDFKYVASITNEGISNMSGYTVTLLDQSNNVLSTNTGPTLAPREIALIELPWNPTTAGNFTIRAVVELAGDGVLANNATPALDIIVQPDADILVGTVGNGNILHYTMPFNFWYRTSVVQTIYYEHDLLSQAGVITEIQYFNDFQSNISAGKPIKVWMANTSVNELDTWLPETEFELVYSGTTIFPSGENDIVIQLDEPFVYYGQNLVIMVERSWDNIFYQEENNFYLTNTPDFPLRSRFFESDDNVFNWTQPGTPSPTHPNTVFKMNFDGGSVSGLVTDISSNPLENVKIQIVGKNIKQFTNEDGEYSFDLLLPGNYKFNAFLHGYFEEESAEITVQDAQNSVVDFVLTPIPKYQVSGKVTGNDQPSGLDNVVITLSGYDNYTVTSAANGDYLITEVYDGFTYTITAQKEGYYIYTDEITINGANLVFDFMLNEILYMPGGYLTAEIIDDEYVLVEWGAAGTPIPTTYILDDGTAESGMLPGDSAGNLYMVGEEGVIVSVDAYALFPLGFGAMVTMDIYNEQQVLIGQSLPFSFEKQEVWVNVELPDVHYDGNFYVMMNFYGGMGSFIGFDTNGPNSQKRLSFFAYDGFFINVADIFGDDGVFMIRVNALTSSGKKVTYGENTKEAEPLPFDIDLIANSIYTTDMTSVAPECTPTFPQIEKDRAFIDYIVHRLKDGQPETQWEEITTTTELYYNDYELNSLPWGQYRYAVRARYTGGATSQPRLSNIVNIDMFTDYTVTITTNTGASAEGAAVTLTNVNGDNIFSGVANAAGVTTINVWRGIYDMNVKLSGFQTHEEQNIDITEQGSKTVLLYEVPYPPAIVYAQYFEEDENVVVTWAMEGDGKTYILDDGTEESGGWGYNPGYEGAMGNMFVVGEAGDIISVDIYLAAWPTGTPERKVTMDIYNVDRQLVYRSDEFSFHATTDRWVNVELDYAPYDGTFYAMFRWTPTDGLTSGLGLDENGPNSQSKLGFTLFGGIWTIFGEDDHGHEPAGVFMIRVNAYANGKSTSYGYNSTQESTNPTISQDLSMILTSGEGNDTVTPEWIPPQQSSIRGLIDYNVYRLIPGQPEDDWTTLVTNFTGDTYTDDVSNLTGRIYQYAVKARYTDNVLSRARLSNIVDFDSGINDNSMSNVVVYPNPFRNEIYINATKAIKNVSITNATGQKIKSVIFDGKAISTEELPQGVYFVTIEDLNGDKLIYKMIKK